jgi:hypothetical protein
VPALTPFSTKGHLTLANIVGRAPVPALAPFITEHFHGTSDDVPARRAHPSITPRSVREGERCPRETGVPGAGWSHGAKRRPRNVGREERIPGILDIANRLKTEYDGP